MDAVAPPAGRIRRLSRAPALLILMVAPFFGEGLSGSSPPLELVLPWHLAFMVALYGCGALVCRDLALRLGSGFRGLVLLGIAYAVWEEGLVDRYWFLPRFWEDSGVGTYSVVWHTNVLLAVHLTVFHAVVSICSSVLVVEWLRPASRLTPWAGRRGLVVAGVVLASTPLLYGEFDQRPPWPVLAATGLLCASLVPAACLLGRGRPGVRPLPAGAGRPPRRGLGWLAFACVLSHWVLTYAVPGTGLTWPLGVALSLLPLAGGLVLVRRWTVTGPYGADGIRVVVGVLWFFVLLDLLVALLGRYDMVLTALLAGWLARRLYAGRQSLGNPAPGAG